MRKIRGKIVAMSMTDCADDGIKVIVETAEGERVDARFCLPIDGRATQEARAETKRVAIEKCNAGEDVEVYVD